MSKASIEMKWNEPEEPLKIVGPIYYVGTKGLSSFLITGNAGHILLFTGMPQSGPLIEASIRKLGFKPEDIKIILTGHAHVDHVGGHAYMQKISHAQVITMAAEKDLIESGGKKDFNYGSYTGFRFDPVKVSRTISDGEVIQLGNIKITGRWTPGHTKGSTTWIMDVQDNGKTYKVVFPDGTSVNPGYRLVGKQSYPGITDDYKKTFSILESLHPDIWLSPHTGSYNFEEKRKRSATEGVNAWVDPEGYAKFVASVKEAFEKEFAKQSKEK